MAEHRPEELVPPLPPSWDPECDEYWERCEEIEQEKRAEEQMREDERKALRL